MRSCAALVVLLSMCFPVLGGEILYFDDPSGLSAEVEFDLITPTTLLVRLENTSTGVPIDFQVADQLLTGVSWDFGDLGLDGGAEIVGGSVIIGPTSASINFDAGSYPAGFDVSGEFGFGNRGGSGQMTNFLSGNASGATRFGNVNLDGPQSLNGPQGGLVANPILVPLGGLGAIQHEIIATLTLSEPLNDLSFLARNNVQVEFGSDAAFLSTPEPSALVMLVAGCCVALRRRRS